MEKNNVYVGSRYVPIFANPVGWTNTRAYEPLMIVTYRGASYTSKTYVPTGIEITNTDYWVPTGNYNVQVEQYRKDVVALSEIVDNVEESVGNLENAGNENTTNIELLNPINIKFKGKSVCVIGDSISADPFNWVTFFTTTLSGIASVQNISESGSSFLGWGTDEGLQKIPLDKDIYIIALGVNDFQGQGVNGANWGIDNIITMMVKLFSHLANKNVYYVSPIKALSQENLTRVYHLGMYSNLYEIFARKFGINVISGDGAPLLSELTVSQYMPDYLHPNAAFSSILSDYILDSMLNGGSLTTVRNNVYTASLSNGFVNMYSSMNEVRFYLGLNGVTAPVSAWTTIFSVPSNGFNPILKAKSNIVDNRGNLIEYRISGNELQINPREVALSNNDLYAHFPFDLKY